MLTVRLRRGRDARFHEVVSSDALNVTTACRRTFARDEVYPPVVGKVGCDVCKRNRAHGFADVPPDYDPPSRPAAAAKLRALSSSNGWITREIRRAAGMDLVWDGG
jgi:hypothetical protein